MSGMTGSIIASAVGVGIVLWLTVRAARRRNDNEKN